MNDATDPENEEYCNAINYIVSKDEKDEALKSEKFNNNDTIKRR